MSGFYLGGFYWWFLMKTVALAYRTGFRAGKMFTQTRKA